MKIARYLHIETLAPGMVGQLTIILAIIFGAMVLVSHLIMRRARVSGYLEVVCVARLNNYNSSTVLASYSGKNRSLRLPIASRALNASFNARRLLI